MASRRALGLSAKVALVALIALASTAGTEASVRGAAALGATPGAELTPDVGAFASPRLGRIEVW